MADGFETRSSVTTPDEGARRAKWWVLFMGNRRNVAALIAAAFAVGVWGLAAVDVLAVGAKSMAPTVFGSGLLAGIITVVTISLSINQLILSRVFGAPNSLSSRLQGTRQLRETVEDLADQPVSPNDPTAFLELLTGTIADRSAALDRALGEADWDQPESVTAAVRDVRAYGDHMDDHVHGDENIVDLLHLLLGGGYAQNVTAVRHIQERYRDELSPEARTELENIEELLEAVAIVRQYFKTLAIQQDFARLSRLMVYTGLLGIGAVVAGTLLYQSGSVTISPSLLPPVVGLLVGLGVSPIAVFTSYVLRAATVGRRTVSAGAFIPARARS